MASHERSKLQQAFEQVNNVDSPYALHGNAVFGNGMKDTGKVGRLRSLVMDEVKDLYFKAVTSFIVAATNADQKYYSWATVAFYYSIFYEQKIRLLLKHIMFVRTLKDESSSLYAFKMEKDEKPKRMSGPNNTDHKAVFHEWGKENNTVADEGEFGILSLPSSDRHLSIFEWYQKMRDIVHYKSATFIEDSVDEYWETFDKGKECGLVKLAKVITNETDIYQEKTIEFDKYKAIYSIPCFVLFKTVEEIKRYKFDNSITDKTLTSSQIKFITEKLNGLCPPGYNLQTLLDKIIF